MSILYNCKHAGVQYRITKFDNDDPVSSYLCTFDECDCPAGQRPTCRHRQMLPRFIGREAVDTGWWFDFDRGGWVDMRTEDELSTHQGVNRTATEITNTPLPELKEPLIEALVDATYEAMIHNNAKWRRF